MRIADIAVVHTLDTDIGGLQKGFQKFSPNFEDTFSFTGVDVKLLICQYQQPQEVSLKIFIFLPEIIFD